MKKRKMTPLESMLSDDLLNLEGIEVQLSTHYSDKLSKSILAKAQAFEMVCKLAKLYFGTVPPSEVNKDQCAILTTKLVEYINKEAYATGLSK